MDLQIVNADPTYTPVRLSAPTTRGYIHVAAEVRPPSRPGPVIFHAINHARWDGRPAVRPVRATLQEELSDVCADQPGGESCRRHAGAVSACMISALARPEERARTRDADA